mmetsp:Transcript_130620/g.227107  ORF Transcript_130620/g.227107 Transcript_130620/m.227107 type:complete len:172 (-) Transcript_130620:327-842(-)
MQRCRCRSRSPRALSRQSRLCRAVLDPDTGAQAAHLLEGLQREISEDSEGDITLKDSLTSPFCAEALPSTQECERTEGCCIRDLGEEREAAIFKFGLTDVDLQRIEKKVIGQESKNVCVVCLEDLNTDGTAGEIIELPCLHSFHKPCILQWLRMSAICPICRADYTMEYDG